MKEETKECISFELLVLVLETLYLIRKLRNLKLCIGKLLNDKVNFKSLCGVTTRPSSCCCCAVCCCHVKGLQ